MTFVRANAFLDLTNRFERDFDPHDYDQAGLGIPAVNFTWPTFLSNAQKLTVDRNGDGTNDQWGFSVSTSFRGTAIYFVWGSGGDLVDNPTHPTKRSLKKEG